MPNRPSFLPLLTDRLHNFPAPPPNLRVCSTKANMTSYDALFISEATTLFYPNFIFQSLFCSCPILPAARRTRAETLSTQANPFAFTLTWTPVQFSERWKQLYQNTLPLEQTSIIFWCFNMFAFLFVCFLMIQNLFPKYWRLLTHTHVIWNLFLKEVSYNVWVKTQ